MRRWLGVLISAFAAAGCSADGAGDGDGGANDARGDGLALMDVIVYPEGAAPDAAPSDAASDAGVDVADASVHQCVFVTPLDCSKGSGTGSANECHDGPSCFVAKVQKAVNDTVAAHPSWFDFNNQWSCPNILMVDAFMDAVVANLVAQGYCAIRDPNAPGEEVTVKHDNAFSENFDIVASNGCARSGAAIYTGWCAPAWW